MTYPGYVPTSESERERVLEALRANAAAFAEEVERHDEATATMRDELLGLLAEGQAAGIGRRALARAAGISLPRLTRLLDDERSDDASLNYASGST